MSRFTLILITSLLVLHTTHASKILTQSKDVYNQMEDNQILKQKRSLQQWNPYAPFRSNTRQSGVIAISETTVTCSDSNKCSQGYFCNSNSICQQIECRLNYDCQPPMYGFKVCKNYQCIVPACMDQRGCHPTQYCSNYECLPNNCQDNSQCPSGMTCSPYTRSCITASIITTSYSPSKSAACIYDSDCPARHKCRKTASGMAQCLLDQSCTSDSQCSNGLTCNMATGRCMSSINILCFNSNDCGQGEQCISNKCKSAALTRTATPQRSTGITSGCMNNADCSMIPNTVCGPRNTCVVTSCNYHHQCQGAFYCSGFGKCTPGWPPFY